MWRRRGGRRSGILRTASVKRGTEQTTEDQDYNERHTGKPIHRTLSKLSRDSCELPVPKDELTTKNSRTQFRRAAIAYRASGTPRRRTTLKSARTTVRTSRLFSGTASRTGSIGWFPRRWPGLATEDKASMWRNQDILCLYTVTEMSRKTAGSPETLQDVITTFELTVSHTPVRTV